MTALAVRWLEAALTASLVLLPLMLGKKWIVGRYQAKTCYLLWLMLGLRLLLPLELTLPLPRPALTLPLAQSLELPELAPVLTYEPGVLTGGAEGPALSPALVLAAVWGLGAAAALALQLGRYLAVSGGLKKAAQLDEAACQVVRTLRREVPVYRADVSTPMTLGILHPRILLPRAGAVDSMALRHELCHIDRGDLWYKSLFLLCTCLHWWNPLVWLLARAAGETVELCCDEDVVEGRDGRFRRAYGQALLNQVAGGVPVSPTLSFGSGDMKGRLMNLFTTKRRGTALLLAVACAALLTGCRVSAAQTNPAQSQPNLSTEVVESQSWVWPLEEDYTLTATYGIRVHPVTGTAISHDGVDIKAEEGTAVLAALGGTVLESDFDAQLGNYVLVEHHDGTCALYGQLKECHVQAGDCLTQGQTLGLVGCTGMATGPHLHFEMRDCNGAAADPLGCYPHLTGELRADCSAGDSHGLHHSAKHH